MARAEKSAGGSVRAGRKAGRVWDRRLALKAAHAGLVQDRRDGLRIFYRVVAPDNRGAGMRVAVENPLPFPAPLAGTWKADRDGWEFTLAPDGSISSKENAMPAGSAWKRAPSRRSG